MSEEGDLLREIRDVLLVIAEPALAQRDEKLRQAIRAIVGRSKAKGKAVRLMDGIRNQSAISKQAPIDQGTLSRMIKDMREAGLTASSENPKLAITLPENFFDDSEANR